MRRPCFRHSASCSSRTAQSNTIFSSGASVAAGNMRERSSATDTVAVPRLPTTTAAAAFAARIADLEIRLHRQHRRQAPPRPCRRRRRRRARAPDRREHGPAAPSTHQRHAVLAARHQNGLRPPPCAKLRRGRGDFVVGPRRAVRRVGKFLAVGRDQRRAAIDAVIAPFGIDHAPACRALARRRSTARITRGVSAPLA